MVHITDANINLDKNTIVTLGNFDGVHLGHQKLIDVLKSPEYSDLKKVVFSFYPHPLKVIKNADIKTIFSRAEKHHLIKNMGIDVFVEYPFTLDFSILLPEEFVRNILVEKLKCKILVIGDGYKFGKNKSGDALHLKDMGEKYGVEVIIVSHEMDSSEKISSSTIRSFILDGEIEKANNLLSRKYFVEGTVVSGNKIGRTIGFPTLNIIPDSEKLLPPSGVYKTTTFHKDFDAKKSITNIGFKPTVGSLEKTIETHIFDFNKDLYGEIIKIEFEKFIRKEKKFANIEELKEQIKNDIEEANREVFL